MEEIISLYQKLIDQINNENDDAARCFQGELLTSYREILETEKEKIMIMLRMLY